MNRQSGRGFREKCYLWNNQRSRMDTDPLNRFDRIIAILIQLQSKRIVRAQELADRFRVSLRTIYRDIRTLEASGVPLLSEAGVGYSIMDGYRLPPVTFTREEAGSFVAAEKLMQTFTDQSLGAYHQSAMYKVKSVLRGAEKDWVATLESHVRIDPTQRLFNEDVPDALEILLESIAERKQVRLHYQSLRADTPAQRNIEPVGLFHENNYWYVLGYCHTRNSYRQFRTDRLFGIRRTDCPFTRAHASLDEHRREECDRPTTLVRIRVDKRVASYIQRDKSYYGFVSEKVAEDQVEMTFRVADLENGFPRWYLTFGDYATILEPRRLKERVRELLHNTERMLSQ